MSETTAEPSAAASKAPAVRVDASPSETGRHLEASEISIQSLLEAGVHFGHQTRRWDPRMYRYIFGERNGTHILDLDQTLPRFQAGLDYVREATASGGSVLFVGTKRQAAPSIMTEACRSGQYYVNNRWLGGMLTNWKTVKKSIDTYKKALEIRGDEQKRNELSKKELARVSRQCGKYEKSLEGIKEMTRLPDVLFVIDVGKEAIAVSEARRLGIPILAVVDSNCNPEGIDFVVPGNDDAVRAIELYCRSVANACIEGAARYQDGLRAQKGTETSAEQIALPSTGKRVVEIKQPPRRGRGGAGGRTHSSGGWADRSPSEEGGPARPEAEPRN